MAARSNGSRRRPERAALLGVGDPMPRITLPLASGGLFDSGDSASAGVARIYWLGDPPGVAQATLLAAELALCEATLLVVTDRPPPVPLAGVPHLVDRGNELAHAIDAPGVMAPGVMAIVVDAAGRIDCLIDRPDPESVADAASRLHAATVPVVVRATAPVLLLDHVLEPDLCAALIAFWQGRDKLTSVVGSDAGNVVDVNAKRRLDVFLDDPALFVRVRDAVMRRVAPAIEQAAHQHATVIEAPRIGCYDAATGGWFRRHRDNTSRQTAHRQFAISINLNDGGEYEGGELRFPEFGRQLYRPALGAAAVFSTALLHEVNPVRRGRRFGVFTFLSSAAPATGARLLHRPS